MTEEIILKPRSLGLTTATKEELEKQSRKTPEGPVSETKSPSHGEAVGESTGTVK